MTETTDKKEREISPELRMKIKRKIKLTEKNLTEIEQALKDKIREIGSSEAGRITGYSRSYLTDIINRDMNISYRKTIELAKKLLIKE